jgi:NAD(P)-dependent dehydrogenase (short-subunit alcohol dehydrogenase family)
MNPSFSFDDTSVLVTGSTSGIGAAIAEAFGRCGASVMVTGRDEDRGNEVCQKIQSTGGRAEFLAGNVTDSGFCNQLVQVTAERFGGLDVLVNSAGIIYHAIAEETTDRQWHDTLAANVNGTFFSCRAAIPVMREGGGGVIINIASDAGLTGSPHLVAYCTSKGAVIQMTRAMAIDHGGEGIRMVALCPGDVDTPMLRGEFADRGISAETGLRQSAESVPLGRVCSREEVASLALYVASDAARFMTGTAVALDGGSRA